MIDDSIIQLVRQIAPNYSLDPALVCAIVEQESDGDTWLVRWEKGFDQKYIVPLEAAGKIHPTPPITEATEAVTRAMSWGLMQIMGETAREAPVNYYGRMAALCDPNTGITQGCKALQHKLSLAGGDVRKGLDLWNGGADPAYPDQVLARVAQYKTAAPPDPFASPISS